MGFEIEWLVKGRVVWDTVSGDIDAQMIADHDNVVMQYLNTSDKPLMHMIVDFSNVTSMPGVGAFSNIRWTKDERLGWVIVYGVNNPLIRFISSTALQITKTRYRFVSTRSQAVEFLQSMDKTLPDLVLLQSTAQS